VASKVPARVSTVTDAPLTHLDILLGGMALTTCRTLQSRSQKTTSIE
jgi:hypothetical protein